jgi:hypothetical protein
MSAGSSVATRCKSLDFLAQSATITGRIVHQVLEAHSTRGQSVNFAQQVGRFQLRLFGPLELIAPNGDDIAPRGRRARAIIAILAIAGGKPLERAVLQDKLWSGRPQLQGRDSLKKALAEIRQALGLYASALLVESGSLVALNTSLVDMDLVEDTAGGWPQRQEFLAGIDIPDPEFEDWLRLMRTTERLPPARAAAQTGVQPASVRPIRLSIGIMPAAIVGMPDWVCDVALDRIALALAEVGSVRVEDYRSLASDGQLRTREADLLLLASFSQRNGQATCTLILKTISSGEVLWSKRHSFSGTLPDDDELSVLSATAVDQMHAALRTGEGMILSDHHIAMRTALSGIDHIFRLGSRDCAMASELISRAIESDDRGIFHAWMAFLSAFELETSGGRNRADLMARADEHAAAALMADPNNPLLAALLGHVYAFVHRDLPRAFETVAPFRSARPVSPMFHDCLSMLHFYSGDLRRARPFALSAVSLGQSNPYRYSFFTSMLMIDMAQGDVASAISWGERALAVQARAGMLFEPALRYLCASYTQAGDIGKAARIYAQVRRQKPDFTPEMLTVEDFPVPNAAARGALYAGFSRLRDQIGE